MQKLSELGKSFDKIAVTVFTVLFMTVGFLQTCSLTFGNKIISLVQWPTILLGGVILLFRIINFKQYISSRGIVLLILFSLSYVVSSLITFKYGWYENLRFLIFMVFQFGLLYATNINETEDDAKRRTNIAVYYYLIVSAILSLASFTVMIAGYNKVFYGSLEEALPTYYIGFWNGRLYGVYWDPNIAAVIAAVAIIISVYYTIVNKKTVIKALNILNIVLQFMYLVFSGSRTGNVALSAGAVMLVVLLTVKRRLFANTAKNVIAVILAAAITFSVTYFGPLVLKAGVNSIVNSVYSQEEKGNTPRTEVAQVTLPLLAVEKTDGQQKEIDIFDRGYDLSGDISNQRFAIWRSAFSIFKKSPIFGVSRANIIPFAKEHMPDTYIVNNYYMNFDSMHNAYIEILTSSGIVGIVLFMAFMIWVIIAILKNNKKIMESRGFYFVASAIGVCTVLAVCSLFIAEMVFVISPASTVLWVMLGGMTRYIKNIEKASETNENT